MGSTRLPGKMILQLYREKGLLELLLGRILDKIINIPIVVATSKAANNDPIEAIGNSQNIRIYRGSEENVLERFIGAARENGIKKIIRVCADNPFLDITALQCQIDRFQKVDSDYACYCLADQTPSIKTHYGFWAEAVKLTALEKVATETSERFFQEHVTNYIYSFPEKFNIDFTPIDSEIEKAVSVRLTVDTQEDFELAKSIYLFLENNHIPFTALEIIRAVKDNNEWLKQMASQIQENSK
jgi:spore coat polysaccharide biosynthesis protein SpsF